MRAYYASKISENILRTDEGYLICKNVPISRTGYQDYLAEELGLDDLQGQMVPVYRSPEEVFSQEAMASFEGKPVCNEHPQGGVNSGNVDILLKGIVRDVRRGNEKTEDGEELLVADFIIYNEQLIGAIQNGKRDVSCGYICEYVMNDDGIVEQKKIRGNHVAVVNDGRAGPEVSIQDSKPIQNNISNSGRRHRLMAKKKSTNPGGLIARLSAAIFSTDAAPEDKAEILEEVGSALLDAAAEDEGAAAAPADNHPAEDNDTEDNDTNDNQAVMDAVGQLADQVGELAKMVQAMQHAGDTDPLEQLEAELLGADSEAEDNAAEDSETEDENLIGDNDGTEDNQPDMDTADQDPDEGEDPVGVVVNDRAALLREIRKMKPIIAKIPDAKARRMMSDSLAKSLRMTAGKRPKPAQDGYAGILQVQKQAAKRRTHDSKPKDQSSIGRNIRDSLNPHYKNKK